MSELKNTVVAYRCPYCGKGVISNEGVFALTAEKISLRCPCKRSEAVITYDSTRMDTLKITVPCTFCPKPHTFALSTEVFVGKDLFTLSCPYTGSGNVFIGELDHVRAEIDRTELEILNAMDEHGVESFEDIHKKQDETDPILLDNILYVLGELDEENEIHCNCNEPSHDYELSREEGGIRISCRQCQASALIPCDSSIGAHAFLEAYSLKLS